MRVTMIIHDNSLSPVLSETLCELELSVALFWLVSFVFRCLNYIYHLFRFQSVLRYLSFPLTVLCRH